MGGIFTKYRNASDASEGQQCMKRTLHVCFGEASLLRRGAPDALEL
jgi:hypothetical protein